MCVFGQHNYGDRARGEGYEYANFIPALRRLGHEVIFLDSWNRNHYRTFAELNRALLCAVDKYRPEVVFSVLTHYEIWLETWEILRGSGIAATVNWATDDSWKYSQFSRLVAPAFHAFTTTCPDAYSSYQRDGISHVLLTQWAANAAGLRPPLSAGECHFSVSFVGTAYGKRRTWVDALRRRGIDVACFGHGWPHGPVAAEDIPRIIHSSVISLNFANSGRPWQGILSPLASQIKARMFEVPGAGGFLLTEWANGMEQYYEGEREVAVFRDLEEMENKIRHYLAHPAQRDAIAWAGYERTRAVHTYDQRLVQVLGFALNQHQKYLAGQGAPTFQIDWDRFEEASHRHRVNRRLMLVRRALIAACSAAWGSAIGPRAARRLVFELSWRLTGARTYSSEGWPGRMFYDLR
ncbi:MAG: glycosyltransferase [bacterium]|nr:glycosyltransferase [bacterium]